MRSIAVTAQKGGVGKTTVAVHLAVAAMRAGERVLVLDADPQGSCMTWSAIRDENEPRVEAVEPTAVGDRIGRAPAEGFSLVIVDTAPRASTSLAALLRSVDFVLVPTRPSAFDIATIGASLAIIAAAGTRGTILLNACPPRAPEIAEAREAVAGLALPLCPVEVAERRAYGRAVASGQAVVEFDPNGPAAAEMVALWNFIVESTG